MKRICVVLAFLAAAAIVGAEVIHVDNRQLQSLLEAGVPVVDIRTTPEWNETGIIEGSHLLTFFDTNGRYDAAAWMRELSGIATPEQPVVLICRTGNRTSSVATFLSKRVGYDTVYNVKYGITHWISQGKRVVRPAPPQP